MIPSFRVSRWLLALALLVPQAVPSVAARPPLRPALQTSGPFVNSGQALAGETGNGVALGDLDGDGDVDALVANDHDAFEGGAIHLWRNDGAGTFTSGEVLSVGTADAYGVALGDLDGDGDLDAVTAGQDDSSRVWVNQGGSQAGTEGDLVEGDSLGTFSTYAVTLGDVDNDGDVDVLAVGNSNQVWLNDGDANLTAGPALPFLFSRGAALAHLDGDGYLDAVISDSGSGNNQVYWNNGNWTPGPGTFAAGPLLATPDLSTAVSAADLDDDDALDIFLATTGPDVIYWNEGTRTFSPPTTLAFDDSSWAVAVDDVDGDELPDVVVGNITADPNRLWHNLGGRVLTVTQTFGDELALYWSRGLALADLTGDAALDLFEVTTAEDRVWVSNAPTPILPNDPAWQTQVLDTRGNAGLAPSLALDANGHPHLSYVRQYEGSDGVVSYLSYARWDGVRWHSEVVSPGARSPKLALDSAGNPHIAYVAGNGMALSYAAWDGAAWQLQTVATVSFPHTLDVGRLALDSGGAAHILYNSFSNTSADPEHLRYARQVGAGWPIETIETNLIYDSDLALDAAGTPHISYAVRDAFDTYLVKYGVRSGGTWQIETVDGDVPDGGVFVTSLALDSGGTPHLGYVLDDFAGGDVVRHAARNGGTWSVAPIASLGVEEDVLDVSLAVASDGNPHLMAYVANFQAGTYRLRYDHWTGSAWQAQTLDSGLDPETFNEHLVSLALDADGNLHAGYYESGFEDLRYVTWAPTWQVRPLPEPGFIRSPAVDVDNRLEGAQPHVAYYKPGSGQVIQATWDDSWNFNPADFVSSPVEDVALAAGTRFAHLSYYDADNTRLMYTYWDGSAWLPRVVDESGNAGRYNDIVLGGHNEDGAPRIAYWNDVTRRIAVARPHPTAFLWDLFPNNAGPALDADSGRLSAAALPDGDVGVAYYDGANGDLRYARWDATSGNWTDERVDGAVDDVGQLNSVQMDYLNDTPVVAYLAPGEVRWAYKVGGVWQSHAVPGTQSETITGLSLELGLNTRERARLAYTTASGGVYLAYRRNGAWQIEVVATSGAAPLSELSSALDSRVHLAYARTEVGLSYAFRTANVDVNLTLPRAQSSLFGGGYNPLYPCHDDGNLLGLGSGAGRYRPPAAPARHGGPHAAQAGPLNDDTIFDLMGDVFAATPAGQSYISQYNQYGVEMGQIGLADPALLWDAYGTLQNFMPGLEALVTGHGSEHVVTQAMVDDALDIWQRVAAAGSPALAGAIQAELAEYDNLQDFVGMTFDQWAEAIGVAPPAAFTSYLPILHRP